ncbi:MAG: haloacid dehalogenase-like hydrolase, partial [Planctomycetaceae bacterium]|nr:haloacid dehalogenase-like hydrolase [Planctomycetaceae bacterium]
VTEFWGSGGERQWISSSLEAIHWLSEAGFAVYVVSGTPRLVLEPLTQYLPIPGTQILGLGLAADSDNQATGKASGIPTHGPGKAAAIQEATTAPIYLAAGNSHIDIEMMALSNDLHWAIEPDQQLRSVATRENWTIIDNP